MTTIDYARLEALALNDIEDDHVLLALIAAAKERDLFADEMSKRGLALDSALSEIARVRALLEVCEATHEAKARMIVSLRALLDEAKKAEATTCGHNSTLDILRATGRELGERTAELARLRAMLDEAREVVRPFAAVYGEIPQFKGSKLLPDSYEETWKLPSGACARARAFLVKLGEQPAVSIRARTTKEQT